MSIFFDMFGTQDFHNHYSNPTNKLDTEISWFENYAWEDLEDDSTVYATYGGTIPDPSPTDMEKRAYKADSWLQDNFGYYDSSTCCIVLDYRGDELQTYNGYVAESCSAGGYTGKTALVDYNAWPPEFASNLSPPDRHTLAHEVGHIFCAEHDDGGIASGGNVSYLKRNVEGSNYCFGSDRSYNESWKEYTHCSKGKMENKIDSL